MTALDILSLGEAMVEFNQAQPGSTQWQQGFGGDCSNFAIAAARQGARVGCLGALGDDRFGALLRALWDREGIDHGAVASDPAAFTAAYFVSHDVQGHHFDFIRRGSAASRISAASLPRERVRAARLVHTSGITLAISAGAREAAFAALAEARAAGRLTSFDTNLRLKLWPVAQAREAIGQALGQCDIALPGAEDMLALTGLADPDALADHCLARGARVVALKLGDRGALVADAVERHRIAPFPCRTVDATGAGDAFGGAFVARWLAGDSLLDAGRYAACAAALSTEGFGAVAPIPHASRVLQALAGAAAGAAAAAPGSNG